MWGWGRPKRDLPVINYAESDSESESEDFEAGLNFASPLTTPQRPLPTREGSPTQNVEGGPTLADNVDDTLEEAQWKLYDIATVREEIEELTDLLVETDTKVDPLRPEVGEEQVPESPLKPEVGEEQVLEFKLKAPPDSEVAEVPSGIIMPDNDDAVIQVDFDAENKEDGDKAQEQARHIKMEFEVNDIKFWFSQLENEMLMTSINSQWLKKSVLQRNLPNKQKEDVKDLLTLPKSEAGNSIYLDIKTELIRIYAPKAQDSYQKALTRTMVGLPSQLGTQIINDICKKHPKLTGCCCDRAALAIWSMQLPIHIRAHISNREFTKDTYKQVFEAADKVYLSGKQVSIAALAAAHQPQVVPQVAKLDETVSAFDPHNQPQVAAVASSGARRGKPSRGRGRGRGQGQTSGNNSGNASRGPKPEGLCDRHAKHGSDAWYCVAPHSCPWKDRTKPRA